MQLSIKVSLFIAIAILFGSLVISQFEQTNLISATILVLASPLIVYYGYALDRKKLKACVTKQNHTKKSRRLIVGGIVLLTAFVIAASKVIYQWWSLSA